ncbi:hypothetical protein ACTMTI_31930 [Nonomuraea sp. H19]|uniref:hypothetical protein n=1 Tax=Nonomuraea sp. H19 TaxID=3452206 RepID=UPI003F8A1BE9
MLTRMTGGLALAAVASVLPTGAAYAGDAPRSAGPAPLIGNVTVFNDEIVEPVSLPLSTCGGLLQVLSKAPSDCEGASRVSDDDA